MTMAIERPLLDILACPIDKQGLLLFDDEAILYNPRLRRVYRIADDHLVMLAARAEPVPEIEHERLMKRAGHGDAIGTAGLDAVRLANGSLRLRVRTVVTPLVLISIIRQTCIIPR